MTTMSTTGVHASPGEIRRVIREGGEIDLTWHGRPYARIVPLELLAAERAELARLRSQLEEYQRRESAA